MAAVSSSPPHPRPRPRPRPHRPSGLMPCLGDAVAFHHRIESVPRVQEVPQDSQAQAQARREMIEKQEVPSPPSPPLGQGREYEAVVVDSHEFQLDDVWTSMRKTKTLKFRILSRSSYGDGDRVSELSFNARVVAPSAFNACDKAWERSASSAKVHLGLGIAVEFQVLETGESMPKKEMLRQCLAFGDETSRRARCHIVLANSLHVKYGLRVWAMPGTTAHVAVGALAFDPVWFEFSIVWDGKVLVSQPQAPDRAVFDLLAKTDTLQELAEAIPSLEKNLPPRAQAWRRNKRLSMALDKVAQVPSLCQCSNSCCADPIARALVRRALLKHDFDATEEFKSIDLAAQDYLVSRPGWQDQDQEQEQGCQGFQRVKRLKTSLDH